MPELDVESPASTPPARLGSTSSASVIPSACFATWAYPYWKVKPSITVPTASGDTWTHRTAFGPTPFRADATDESFLPWIVVTAAPPELRRWMRRGIQTRSVDE